MKLPRNQFYMKSSELFESEVYLEEVSDVMCIAQAGEIECNFSYWPSNIYICWGDLSSGVKV